MGIHHKMERPRKQITMQRDTKKKGRKKESKRKNKTYNLNCWKEQWQEANSSGKKGRTNKSDGTNYLTSAPVMRLCAL